MHFIFNLSLFVFSHRPAITIASSHMEFSSTSQTREPCTKITHPGLKRPTILYDQARFTLIGGLCPSKLVRPVLTLSVSRGCIIPVWIRSRILTLVSPRIFLASGALFDWVTSTSQRGFLGNKADKLYGLFPRLLANDIHCFKLDFNI